MNKRARIVLAAGAVLMLLFLSFRQPLQRQALEYLVVHANAPTEEAMDETVAHAGTPAEGLSRLWSATRLPQRHYVMQYLRTHPEVCHASWAAMRPLVLDAVASRDVDLQEPAMAVLVREALPDASFISSTLLDDPDPDVRLAGVRALAQSGNAFWVPRLLERIDDPERQVRLAIPIALQQITGGKIPMNISDPESRRAGVLAWRAWCVSNGNAGSGRAPQSLPATTSLVAPEIVLNDTNGRSFRLSDLRGKPVLLNFWATWCGPCMQEVPTLVELQQRHAGALRIIGVCADSIPDDDGDTPSSAIRDPMPAVLKTMAERKINYPVVMDRKGIAFSAYDGGGIPISVLIDAQGRIRRRFLGPRSLEAMDGMVRQLANP